MAAPPSASPTIAGCVLLASAAGVLAQLALFLCALGLLMVKRQIEVRRGEGRTWAVWGLDVSKQGFSSGAAHICGMLWAAIIQMVSKEDTVSKCAWYLVVFVVDTSLGVFICVTLHNRLVACVKAWSEEKQGRLWFGAVAQCGQYGAAQARGDCRGMVSVWAPQMVEWVLCTIIGRVVSGGTVLIFWRQLVFIAQAIDDSFRHHPDAELAFVMVMGPLVLNLVQAWVQDMYLRFRRATSAGSDGEPESVDHLSPAVQSGEGRELLGGRGAMRNCERPEPSAQPRAS